MFEVLWKELTKMKIEENLVSNLTVLDSDDVAGKLMVADNETGEFGDIIAHTYAGKLLVQWRDAIKSDTHEEFELILLSAPNITAIVENKSDDARLVKNPFGLFGEKKWFYVDFWGDGDLHQTRIKARNKNAAIKIAKRGYKDFSLESIEEDK